MVVQLLINKSYLQVKQTEDFIDYLSMASGILKLLGTGKPRTARFLHTGGTSRSSSFDVVSLLSDKNVSLKPLLKVETITFLSLI